MAASSSASTGLIKTRLCAGGSHRLPSFPRKLPRCLVQRAEFAELVERKQTSDEKIKTETPGDRGQLPDPMILSHVDFPGERTDFSTPAVKLSTSESRSSRFTSQTIHEEGKGIIKFMGCRLQELAVVIVAGGTSRVVWGTSSFSQIHSSGRFAHPAVCAGQHLSSQSSLHFVWRTQYPMPAVEFRLRPEQLPRIRLSV
ncbi:uncharacterized protein BKA78DRAFT_319922 [Phyllosticta capitalensis]|uniref:uncharacterized protein n=1 Tax=Phyllosticta capitalensis TaxID=121624 RepID=UPI00312F7791